MFARAVTHEAVLIDALAWCRKAAVILLQLLASRADVVVALVMVGEYKSSEGAVTPARLIKHRDVRLNGALVRQPSKIVG